MTLDEALDFSRTMLRATSGDEVSLIRPLARYLIDTLGEAQPCGFDAPFVRGGYVHIPTNWDGSAIAGDARAMAAMLLHAYPFVTQGVSK